MKGIILAGGAGTRLYPLPTVTSKQLLPVYDKPMIYYSLSVLMLAGIDEILLISTPEDLPNFRRLFGTGEDFGVKLSYCLQQSPDGLAQALTLGEDFLGNEACALILGDNLFYGNGFGAMLRTAVQNAEEQHRATVFGSFVQEPRQFGIVEFDRDWKAVSLEEKPEHPKSSYAVTGLYFYPAGVSELAKKVTPSARGELEITDLNRMYLDAGELDVQLLGRGFTWMDMGTIESLARAGDFVRMLETRQGIEIAALEEIAFRNGWITRETLSAAAERCGRSPYGEHLKKLADGTFWY